MLLNVEEKAAEADCGTCHRTMAHEEALGATRTTSETLCPRYEEDQETSLHLIVH